MTKLWDVSMEQLILTEWSDSNNNKNKNKNIYVAKNVTKLSDVSTEQQIITQHQWSGLMYTITKWFSKQNFMLLKKCFHGGTGYNPPSAEWFHFCNSFF